MNNKQLNVLAVAAKDNEVKAWEIKAHYMPLIEKLTSDNWHKMNNEVSFIEDCYRKIDYAIRSYNAAKGDFDGRVRTLLNQSVKEYCGRRGNRRKNLDSVEELSTVDNEETFVFQLRDDAVDVEAQAVNAVRSEEIVSNFSNEMDKLIVSIILEADEALNQSDLTRKLAEATGRTFNSARGVVRKFVQRQKEALV